MRLDEEVIMDFFREYISISVSSITPLYIVLVMSFNLIDDGSSALFLIMIFFLCVYANHSVTISCTFLDFTES